MPYLFQFGMILAISFVGELLHALLPLPVPASIYGILILFALLYFKVIRIPQIRQASMFLIDIMPILFLPGRRPHVLVAPDLLYPSAVHRDHHPCHGHRHGSRRPFHAVYHEEGHKEGDLP